MFISNSHFHFLRILNSINSPLHVTAVITEFPSCNTHSVPQGVKWNSPPQQTNMATECPASCRRDDHKHKLLIRNKRTSAYRAAFNYTLHLLDKLAMWVSSVAQRKREICTMLCDLIANVFINNRERYSCGAKDDFCRICHPCCGCAKVHSQVPLPVSEFP